MHIFILAETVDISLKRRSRRAHCVNLKVYLKAGKNDVVLTRQDMASITPIQK